MTRTLLLTAQLAIAVAAVTLSLTPAQAEIPWQTQLKTAHAQAQEDGKLILLHFYDDNCVWCDRLEKGAFQTPAVQAAIQKGYVPVKIHAGQNPSIAKTFQVTRFPTDVIVTTQGQALSHTVSPQDAGRYVAMLAQYVTPPVADQAVDTMIAAAVPAEAIAQATPTAPFKNASFAVPADLSGTPATQVSSRTESSMSMPAGMSAPAKSELDLAMDGYCAVTVCEEDRWVEGNPELGVVHLGQLYLFSSQAAMEKFVANPEPFTPVLNGIDVVRFFEERKIIQGNREWGLKDPDHNRMYFFADEAALNHFYNQHARYTDASLAVMKKAVKDANP